MKETNYQTIHNEIVKQLQAASWSLLEYTDTETAALLVFNIYLTSDVLKGFGQDIEKVISVISSKNRISTIAEGHASFFKSDSPLCEYNDLSDDIRQILIIMQASIDRMQYNSE